ncbi:molybdenum ABC transporter ATP-binding protein [Rhodobacteraceae bacterium WD3A24]|nr:molybdenum ABC transporter ATP-binding protein [Rhodobacteraceae bacterium WD3A24]
MTLSVALHHTLPGFVLDIDVEAPPGVTALFGRSGSGKTTVVQAVAGLMRPDAGRVVLDGTVLMDSAAGIWVPPHKRRLGYVFQEGRLFPHLTVRANLRYGRWFARASRRDRAEEARVVEMLGIGDLLDRRPGGLSGGEKQRVAIGRALLSSPRMLLMDEPLASLDEARKEEILPYLERLRDETALPILYVSHSVGEVARLATTVVAMREGRVVSAGPAADVLAQPQAVHAVGLSEASALIYARIAAQEDDGLTRVETSAGPLLVPALSGAPGTRIRLRVHAQDVILARGHPGGLSALNILPARVIAVRPGEGPGVMVELDVGEERLLARITRRSAQALGLAPGEDCYAIIKSLASTSVLAGTPGRAGPG